MRQLKILLRQSRRKVGIQHIVHQGKMYGYLNTDIPEKELL